VRSTAVVQVAERQLEIHEIPVPVIKPGEALIKIEAAGICGSDHDQFNGNLARAGWSTYPVIPGHEPVGRVVEIGEAARRAWGLALDDLIAVESVVPCQTCPNCVRGLRKFCANRFSYGFMPLSDGSGLNGAFSEYMVLRPNSVVHRVPEGISPEIATMYNPLGAGFDWTIERAGMMPGDSVLILGCGQRGIACAIAARSAGAERVFITGLGQDKIKLDLALKFGADEAINIEESPDLVERLRDLTGGGFVDRVIDTTPGAVAPVLQAVEIVRPGGIVVLAGLKGEAKLEGLAADRIILKAIDVRGVVSVSSWGYQRALSRLAAGDLAELHSHSIPLVDAQRAIELIGTPEATHVAVMPGASTATGTR
jgi:threonine dehydrogenase-like Zn-dependent dehydrogenase